QDNGHVGRYRVTGRERETLARVEHEAQATILHVRRQPMRERQSQLPVRPACRRLRDDAPVEELEPSELGSVEAGAPTLEFRLCRGQPSEVRSGVHDEGE